MNDAKTCSRCARYAPVRLARYQQVIGVLVVTINRTYAGEFCDSCRRSLARRTMLVNLTLGWWSPVSFILTPVFVVRNLKQSYRADANAIAEELNRRDSTKQAISDLPWSQLIGIRHNSNIGQQQLTLPIALGAIAALGTFVSAIGTIAFLFGRGNNTVEEAAALQYWSRVGLVGGIIVLSVCFYWHRWLENRADLVPDVLGALFPWDAIYEVSRIHLVVLGLQLPRSVRVLVIVQNRFNQQTDVGLALDGKAPITPLQLRLPDTSAVLSAIDLPTSEVLKPSVMRLNLRVGTRGSGGSLVRFARHAVLTNSTRSQLVTAAMAIGGHFHVSLSSDGQNSQLRFADRQGELEIGLVPVDAPIGAGENIQSACSWKSFSIWGPRQPSTLGHAARWVQQMLVADLTTSRLVDQDYAPSK